MILDNIRRAAEYLFFGVKQSEVYMRGCALNLDETSIYVDVGKDGMLDWLLFGISKLEYRYIQHNWSVIFYFDVSLNIKDSEENSVKLMEFMLDLFPDSIAQKEVKLGVDYVVVKSTNILNIDILKFIAYCFKFEDTFIFKELNVLCDVDTEITINSAKFLKSTSLFISMLSTDTLLKLVDKVEFIITTNQIKYNTLHQLEQLDAALKCSVKKIKYTLIADRECFDIYTLHSNNFEYFFTRITKLINSELVVIVHKDLYDEMDTYIRRIADGADNIDFVLHQ